ncbi:hypothetical protein RRG08_053997 [Elysia crispata]|uniref:Uncharacterized protein n=1 Tax=Elysia crispata TaxID=231223 RepID=A0AAE1ECU3_9GAST|nr:hypothetical protein RRG08_053997 [Elysia crispata]
MILTGLLFLVSLVGHTDASCQTNVDTVHNQSSSDCPKGCKGVCLTEDCIKEAAQVLKFMDRTANPCDNFATLLAEISTRLKHYARIAVV